MFVPTTPGGELKTKLQELDRALGFKNKCKYVGTVGKSVLSMMFRKNPWGAPCGRECLLCQSAPGKCTMKNIVYKIKCLKCPEEAEATYYGETARSTFERAREHTSLIKKMDKESPVVEPYLEQHPGQQVEVTMKVVKKVQRPLKRHTLEGLLISEHSGGPL